MAATATPNLAASMAIRRATRGTGSSRNSEIGPVSDPDRSSSGLRLEVAHALATAAQAGALELAAGGEDVAAARRAHRRTQAAIVHDLGEAMDAVVGAALVGRAR